MIILNKKEKEALNKIIAYNFTAEIEDWEQTPKKLRKNHIYESILVLDKAKKFTINEQE